MTIPTAQSVLHSGVHGRLRREERSIQKIDLQRARRYGMKEPAKRGRVKYTYGGIVFIYDPCSNREVTSYEAPDVALSSSGTKVARPIILKKNEEWDDEDSIMSRELIRRRVLANKDSWTSHSVLVVDMSGSMRRDDVSGARCRSDGVWMAIARDFIKKPLKDKSRTSKTDIISVVLMQEDAEVIFKYELTDWVLYNKLIDLREWTEYRPAGHGNYLPALSAAEKLLMKNQQSSCSLSLMFFSDGKPSDRGDFSGRMGKIAAKFGRRLSVACIGMAEEGEDFSTLNDMVTEATSFGAVASFGKPSLDADSLSNIITGLASSLTASKTEMTNMATGTARKVRMDVKREKVGTPDDWFVTSDWKCYNSTEYKKFVRRVWSWSTRLNDFVQLVDSRCAICYKDTSALGNSGSKETIGTKIPGIVCPNCESHVFCGYCIDESSFRQHLGSDCPTLTHRKRMGKIINKPIPSFDVAMKKLCFGEGAERLVRKFRFIDGDKDFIGPIMVAKESRFVEDDSNTYENRMDYHREFMRTQALASDMAKQFNEALDNIPDHFEDSLLVKRDISRIPRIEFLEPLVVEANDPDMKYEEYNVLVEPMLEGKYQKFNDNMGAVKGQSESVSMDDLAGRMGNLGINNNLSSGGPGLGAIVEEESEEEDSDEEIIEQEHNAPKPGEYSLQIEDEHIPQTFSHFSFEKSKRYFMVVDLQGVLSVKKDRTKCYKLTDPVIHKRRNKKKEKLKKFTFGRTDRGEKGMAAFFKTHKCNELCRLLGLEDKSSPEGHQPCYF